MPESPRVARVAKILRSQFRHYSTTGNNQQDTESTPTTHKSTLRRSKTQQTPPTSCLSSPKRMPSPSPPRLKGREPLSARLPLGLSAKRYSYPSPPKESCKNYAPPASGASTRGQQRAKSSLNASSLPSAAKGCGGGRRSDNTHKTPHGQLERRASREMTSLASIPTSPNYFDVLSEEEE